MSRRRQAVGAEVDRGVPRHDPCGPIRCGDRRGESGVSLVEILLASTLFLVIALATVPMFTRAMVSNTSGNDSTKVANFARGRVEEFVQLPFGNSALTIEEGTEKTFQEYFSGRTKSWKAGTAPADDPAQWLRISTIRQYSVEALEDQTVDPAEALPAGSDPSLIHLKEIQVQVSQVGGWYGPGKTITLRTLKSQ